jgi:hypothetical protein
MRINKTEIDAIVNKDDTSMIDIVKNGEVVRRTKVLSWKKQEVYDAKYNGAALIVQMKTPLAGTVYAWYTAKDSGLCISPMTPVSVLSITEAKKREIVKNFLN